MRPYMQSMLTQACDLPTLPSTLQRQRRGGSRYGFPDKPFVFCNVPLLPFSAPALAEQKMIASRLTCTG